MMRCDHAGAGAPCDTCDRATEHATPGSMVEATVATTEPICPHCGELAHYARAGHWICGSCGARSPRTRGGETRGMTLGLWHRHRIAADDAERTMRGVLEECAAARNRAQAAVLAAELDAQRARRELEEVRDASHLAVAEAQDVVAAAGRTIEDARRECGEAIEWMEGTPKEPRDA